MTASGGVHLESPAIKASSTPDTLAFFSIRYKRYHQGFTVVFLSTTILEMVDKIQVQLSSPLEVLELLLGAGLDRAQASALMGNLPQSQRPERQEDSEGLRGQWVKVAK